MSALLQRARGRAQFLRDRGEIKSPEIIEALIAHIEGTAVDCHVDEPECPSSGLPSGRHQLDTSMESGPHNCFFCSRKM